MKLFFVLVSLALIVGAVAGGALLWDGSYYLYKALDTNVPYVPHGRLINIPLQWPVILISHFVTDINVLKLIFGLVYALVPLSSLLLSWWIVKDEKPELFVWCALGIGFGTLMLQLSFIAEAIIVIQLFWPVMLAIVIRPRRSVYVVVALLTSAIIFSHPFSIALYAFAAALAFAVGLRYRDRRRQSWMLALLFIALVVAAALRFSSIHDNYEADRLSLDALRSTFASSMAGLRLAALVSVYIAMGLVFFAPIVTRSQNRLIRRWQIQSRQLAWIIYALELGCIMIAGILLVIWAIAPRLWESALSFRTWALFVSLPFMGIAALEGLAKSPSNSPATDGPWSHRMRTVQVTGLVFLIILSIQSLSWVSLTSDLNQTLAQSPTACVPVSAIKQEHASALGHWSVTPYSILLQGMTPQKVVLIGDLCDTTQFADGLPIADFDTRNWTDGRFNMQLLAQRLATEHHAEP